MVATLTQFNSVEVFVWPDYTWCYDDEIEDQAMSDDYYVLPVPRGLTDDEVHQLVIDSKCQDPKGGRCDK